MTMSIPVRILSISDDDGLRISRDLLLHNDGYEPESITSNTPISVSRARSFDIALICRSVDPERAMALTDMLRRYHPEIQILSIAPLEREYAYDADFEVAPGPEPLLDAIRDLCDQGRGAGKRFSKRPIGREKPGAGSHQALGEATIIPG